MRNFITAVLILFMISADAFGAAEITIPFKIRNEVIVIECLINGHKASFMVDTGADSTVLSETFVKSIALPVIGETATTKTAAGITSSKILQIESLQCGNRVIRIQVVEMGLPNSWSFDGILGINALRLLLGDRIVIDFKDKVLIGSK